MWQTAKGLENKELTGQFATLPARQGMAAFSFLGKSDCRQTHLAA
jgi:hypothetical protein